MHNATHPAQWWLCICYAGGMFADKGGVCVSQLPEEIDGLAPGITTLKALSVRNEGHSPVRLLHCSQLRTLPAVRLAGTTSALLMVRVDESRALARGAACLQQLALHAALSSFFGQPRADILTVVCTPRHHHHHPLQPGDVCIVAVHITPEGLGILRTLLVLDFGERLQQPQRGPAASMLQQAQRAPLMMTCCAAGRLADQMLA